MKQFVICILALLLSAFAKAQTYSQMFQNYVITEGPKHACVWCFANTDEERLVIFDNVEKNIIVRYKVDNSTYKSSGEWMITTYNVHHPKSGNKYVCTLKVKISEELLAKVGTITWKDVKTGKTVTYKVEQFWD